VNALDAGFELFISLLTHHSLCGNSGFRRSWSTFTLTCRSRLGEHAAAFTTFTYTLIHDVIVV